MIIRKTIIRLIDNENNGQLQHCIAAVEIIFVKSGPKYLSPKMLSCFFFSVFYSHPKIVHKNKTVTEIGHDHVGQKT